MCKLSVIIPVFNVEPYLQKCVDSVLAQQLPASDYEIILVDDGSSDECPVLCDALAALHDNIRTIHQKNGGPSIARNTGLMVAKGEYVAFMDSDDLWVQPDGMKHILAALATRQTDILLFKRVDIYSTSEIHERDYDTEFINTHSAEEIFWYLVVAQRFHMSACMQLTRRALLVENKIFFVGIVGSEDLDWNLQLWQHVDSVQAINIDMYGYYHREKSRSSTYSIHKLRRYGERFQTWISHYDESKGTMRNAQSIMAYMAELYVGCLYASGMITPEHRPEMKSILHKYVGLLDFAANRKALRAQRVKNIFGTTMMIKLFQWYGVLKRLNRDIFYKLNR